MFSQAILVGRIGREPEMRMAQSGQSILTFSLAVDRVIGKPENQRRETDWHRIVLFGRQAERRYQDLHKGDLILVTGELRIRRYRDNQGVERVVHEVAGYRIRILARARAGVPESAPGVAPTGPEVGSSLAEDFPVQDLSDIPTLPEDEELEEEGF
ncbi:MAG: single-stranded DNA-binding protein [bacterium JZ-2024 1]